MESFESQATSSPVDAASMANTQLELIPIASLDGGEHVSTSSDRAIAAVVTLIWPYSSSTRTTSILAVDPDFRLRNEKGQVRIQFRGHAGKALAASGISIGDSITLKLAGGRYALNEASSAVQTPGRSVDGELIYTRRLDVHISRQGVAVADVHVDEPAFPTIDATPARPQHVEFEPVLLQTPARTAHSPAVWSSPAFATPARNFALAPKSLNDDLADDFNQSRTSKRLKIWGTPGKWHLAGSQDLAYPRDNEAGEENEINEDEDVGLSSSQVSHVPMSAGLAQSMQPPPLPRISTQPSMPLDAAASSPSLAKSLQHPISPRLRPIPSPGLPLISPFAFSVPVSADGSVPVDIDHQGGYFDFSGSVETGEHLDATTSALPLETTADENDLYSASPRLSMTSLEHLGPVSQLPDSSMPSHEVQHFFDEQEYLEFVNGSQSQGSCDNEQFERQRVSLDQHDESSSEVDAEENQVDENKRLPGTNNVHQIMSRGPPDHYQKEPPSFRGEFVDLENHQIIQKSAEPVVIDVDEIADEQVIIPSTTMLPFTPPASQEHRVSGIHERSAQTQPEDRVERPPTPLLTQQSSKISRASPQPQPVQSLDSLDQERSQMTPAEDMQLTYPRPPNSVEGRHPEAGIRTDLSYYTPLSTIQSHMNVPPSLTKEEAVDVFGVVTTDVPDAVRASSGPKDFFTMMHVIDPSSPSSTTLVQVFRPYKASLPRASRGDVVLLRKFLVYRRSPRLVSLLSAESSAWLVWRFERHAAEAAVDGPFLTEMATGSSAETPRSELEECRGPPVEFGVEEEGRAVALRHWWLSLPESVRPNAKVNDSEPRAGVVAKENIGLHSSQIIEPAPS